MKWQLTDQVASANPRNGNFTCWIYLSCVKHSLRIAYVDLSFSDKPEFFVYSSSFGICRFFDQRSHFSTLCVRTLLCLASMSHVAFFQDSYWDVLFTRRMCTNCLWFVCFQEAAVRAISVFRIRVAASHHKRGRWQEGRAARCQFGEGQGTRNAFCQTCSLLLILNFSEKKLKKYIYPNIDTCKNVIRSRNHYVNKPLRSHAVGFAVSFPGKTSFNIIVREKDILHVRAIIHNVQREVIFDIYIK